RHPAVATGVALLDQAFVQGLDGAAIVFAAVQVGPEPGRQRFGVAVELGLVDPLGVLRLDHLTLAQPGLDGVPCQARAPLDLFDWKAIAQVHPADLCQCSHVDHSLIPSCSKNKQETLLKGSKLGEKTQSRGVRFTWKSTHSSLNSLSVFSTRVKNSSFQGQPHWLRIWLSGCFGLRRPT